jgi:hypothetical protein
MEKSFTLKDLDHYSFEVGLKTGPQHNRPMKSGPSQSVLLSLTRYSRALSVIRTDSAGIFFHLTN